jgi:hypothetical protein
MLQKKDYKRKERNMEEKNAKKIRKGKEKTKNGEEGTVVFNWSSRYHKNVSCSLSRKQEWGEKETAQNTWKWRKDFLVELN